uniref:Uncharacterized protein n=1 Tax=Haptolina brevifila TaxID=156173 RepID=A0A7S2DMM6_9EUKA|mmetsp:Transcript_41230/g.82623  ORF Transcript_41230/g.82623 Transcript_41230/m.82623 type:complete len:100 (+) Transcript_41230:164-463(+)
MAVAACTIRQDKDDNSLMVGSVRVLVGQSCRRGVLRVSSTACRLHGGGRLHWTTGLQQGTALSCGMHVCWHQYANIRAMAFPFACAGTVLLRARWLAKS